MRGDRKPGDDSPRQRALAEGDRYEVAELADGRTQVTIDRGTYVVQHAGAAAAVRARAAVDADARDAAVIDAALPAAARARADVRTGGGR